MPDVHALLVGIDRYRPDRIPGGLLIPDLQGCVRDVERMEVFLRHGPLAVPAERVRKLIAPASRPGQPKPAPEEQPTYRNLIREVQGFAERARRGDQVLIHYSGHGASLPTAVPAKKGENGRDESLVPCDAGVPRADGGGFLRDLEIHALLVRLAEHGLRVTLILDCCHSGGVTRALERGRIRGLGHLALTAGHAGPLGSWQDLGALLPERHEVPARERLRNMEGASAWFPQPEGCVLLAACLPTESAREHTFEDGRCSGALTHFFLEAVGDLGPRPTYRRLHHRLLGRIRSRFASQTPVLEGDGEVAFLGRERWPAQRGIPVLETANGAGGATLLLGAGRAQGLAPGARLEVRSDRGSQVHATELEVVECGATSAWATATARRGAPRAVAAGDLAAVVDPGPDTRRFRVATLVPAGAAAEHRATLERLRETLVSAPRPLLEPAAREAETDWLVEVTPGGFYRILDPGGEPLPHQGEAIAVDSEGAAGRLLDRLEDLAQFRAVEDLGNGDTSSPLFGRLGTELFALPCPERWSDPAARIPVGAAPVPTGSLLCLLVRNDSGRDLNLVVLDLQPDWGIQRAYPGKGEGDFTTVRTGSELPVFLRAGLPPWMDHGRDRLKIIAATGPLDTTHLVRDAPGPSTGYRSASGPASRARSEARLRTQLLNSRPTRTAFRNLASISPASHDWTTETVEVRVERVVRGAGSTARGGETRLACPAHG